MQENETGGPSLIKLGKLANGKNFDGLDAIWMTALESKEYTWRELLPIAGQVGRQGSVNRAETLMEALIDSVEEKSGGETALEATCKAAEQIPDSSSIRSHILRLTLKVNSDFANLSTLLDLLMPAGCDLAVTMPVVQLYLNLQPGNFAIDRSFLVPGIVETLSAEDGNLSVRFNDRYAEYSPQNVTKLLACSKDHFPALVLYNPDRLRVIADEDAVEFVKLALASTRENRLTYRDLKAHIVALTNEKGWKDWWPKAKVVLKHEPMVGMSAGSQPTFRILRQADRYEDRLRREFDSQKDPKEKLLQVMAYLDELNREEKRKNSTSTADDELLVHFGNGAAKVAMAVLKENPGLALAGLTLHAEVAARGVDVARPNPKAAPQVLKRLPDPAALAFSIPEALLQRVLNYLRVAMPDTWGAVWSTILTRSSKRLCDVITKGLIEGGQTAELERAMRIAITKPSACQDLLGWMWRTRHASNSAGKYLAQLETLPTLEVVNAMFSLLDSVGKLYGLSMEEKYLKALESTRAALNTQNSKPLLAIFDNADRKESVRLKKIVETNHGISAAQRTQLLGFLRSKHSDIFIEVTHEWNDEFIIYSTEEGMLKIQSALNFIIEEEIPEVAKQIGEAASFGDLSENAEFTAALEKRDQLASRATRLEGELAMAQIISRDMADGPFVNAGTQVKVLSHDTNEEELYTFLGPWDTDTANKVLNYQAPLALAFMGSQVGDVVEYGEEGSKRSWEILEISPAV